MYRHPSSAYPWQDRCPDHKSTFPVGWGEGRCLPEQAQGASVLPGSVLQQLLSTWRVLSSQELGNKLGPLGWGGGTLQTALPPPETLCGPGEICFTQMMLTCLLQVPQKPSPLPTTHAPCSAKGGLSPWGPHLAERRPCSQGVGACWFRTSDSILEALNPCF